MSEVEPDKFRISDAERQSALDALGEHMRTGRLDVEEYGERTARVTTAKTRGELTEVFADLPEPRPQFAAVPAQPQPVAARDQVAVRKPDDSAVQRTVNAVVPLTWLVTIVLCLTVLKGMWVLLAVPIAVTIIAGAVAGDDWRHNRRGHRGHRGPRGHWHHN